MTSTQFAQTRYLGTFLKFLLAYALIVLLLAQEGDSKFERLHLAIDTSNGILSLLLAVFLFAEQYNVDNKVRQQLAIGFGLAACTEVLHALVGIEWYGSLEWIATYSNTLRPATWPPSTYVLPVSVAWMLWLSDRKISLPPGLFAACMLVVTLALFGLAWILPKYADTGMLGIHRPTQVPLLLLWMYVIAGCWRDRARHPLYEGLAWLGVMLFLSDLFMLYSTSPHEKFTMMAHSGKLLAYMLLHTIQMRIAAADSRERRLAEHELRIAAIAFESQEGMIITDANSVILRVNGSFTHITGYAAEDVIGKTPNMLNSGRQDAHFYTKVWESINNTGSWQGEIWNRRRNGETYPEYLTITAVKDPGGIVTNYVATFNDITVSKAAADEIKHLAFYDPLTRLPNRRLLMDRLVQALASSARNGRSGALLFIDLDNFKTLNDTFGHDVGDLLLQQVSHRLELCVREGDTVARLGGDEFVVMLEDLSKDSLAAAAQTESVGEKILAALGQSYQLAANECRSTPSMGATLFNGHGKQVDALFKQADIAMYQAKKDGRNTLRFFDPVMQATITTRVALEADLRRALSGMAQLQLYYQAQVESSGRLTGAEVLLRWQHPERGLISPAEFIPLAEESGLILSLGHWVLTTACQQLAAWAVRPETAHLTLAVNISAKQLHLPTFVDEVLTLVDCFKIDPAKLKLEITESMLLGDVNDIIIKMAALKVRGINFSMDDFGTGYSSLQYLKLLPLDQLKIDQSFVRDIVVDDSDRAIVRTIIAMAHSLGLDVIAEGVETEEQRQILLNKGCASHQGYLFGKPVPIEAFEASFKQG